MLLSIPLRESERLFWIGMLEDKMRSQQSRQSLPQQLSLFNPCKTKEYWKLCNLIKDRLPPLLPLPLLLRLLLLLLRLLVKTQNRLNFAWSVEPNYKGRPNFVRAVAQSNQR